MPPAAEPTLRMDRWIARRNGQLALQIPRLTLWRRRILALIGPSGSGKTTLLRCLARLVEPHEGLVCSGAMALSGLPADAWPLCEWRRRVCLVPSRPVAMPGTARENVAIGARCALGLTGRALAAAVDEAMARAGLRWPSRCDLPATALPGPELRRLCLARALAVRPEVLLLDEPATGLDPAATADVEATLARLGADLTIVITTHNLHLAARVSDDCAVVDAGRLVDAGPTTQVYAAPTPRSLLTGFGHRVTAL